MKVILGTRDYEKTNTGRYPKYNLRQMNLYVIPECAPYTGIAMICNIKSYDLFGRYKDELTEKEKELLDEAIKGEYGIHNVSMDDIIDWNKFEYDEQDQRFTEKITSSSTEKGK